MTIPLYHADRTLNKWKRRGSPDLDLYDPTIPWGGPYAAGQQENRLFLGMHASESTPRPSFDESMADHIQQPIYLRRVFTGNWLSVGQINTWENQRLQLVSDYGLADTDVAIAMSVKVPGTDWAGVTSGTYDSDIIAARERLKTFSLGPCRTITVHHEPTGTTGHTGPEWREMQKHCSNLFASAYPYASYAAIMNGFVFGTVQGWTDTAISDYIDDEMITIFNTNKSVIGADFYATLRVPVADIITDFLAWADRKGVNVGCAGEIGARTAAQFTDAYNVCMSRRDKMLYASLFNSFANSIFNWRALPNGYPAYNGTNNTGLVDEGGTAATAELLAAFKAALTTSTSTV